MQTSDNLNYYYGADYATKAITDIHDIDTTDLDEFVEFFKSQYAVTFPSKVYTSEDTRLLYKNILSFYRALGTEDSFKMLFRLLFNEEIEIYYPKTDMLIASGGNYMQQVRIKVQYTENISNIKNSKLIGSSSGAYGTVEDVDIIRPTRRGRVPGQIAKTSSPYSFGVSNTRTFDSDRFVEEYGKAAFVTLSDQHGHFDLFESIYYIKDNEMLSSVSNTVILPVPVGLLFDVDFNRYNNPNNVISFTDGLHSKRSLSTYTPWGSGNVGYANSGDWHTTGPGQGEIQLFSNTTNDTPANMQHLRIGNNTSSPSSNGDLRHLVYSGRIGIESDDVLYKLTVIARDIGGNSAASVAEGNRFSAGIVCIRHNLNKINSEYQDTYENPLWLACHQQAIDDNFFEYTAYFKGRQQSHDINSVYPATNYGNGGRIDLTSGPRYYNSIHKAIAGKVILPFNTTWITPTFKVNEPVGATYSQGITDIAGVRIEEIGTLQSNFTAHGGMYRDDASLLSTKGAHLQDGHYRQIYAYDIRSQQQMKDYNTVIRKSTHPAGLKLFGTTVVTNDANNISILSANSFLLEPFSPLSVNSLAGWWSADKISLDNIQYRNFSSNALAKPIFGSTINRIPAGISVFNIPETDYGSIPSLASFSNVIFTHTEISHSPVDGIGKLKVTDEHHGSTNPKIWLKNAVDPAGSHTVHNYVYTDDEHPIVLDPRKKWLVSCYAAVSNTISDTAHNSFLYELFLANSSGHDTSVASAAVPDFSSENVWERKSQVIDLTPYNNTRAALAITLASRNKFVQPTGNTIYHFDGFMVEEYDPVAHNAGSPYNPSVFTLPGINGANVTSWYDQSQNEHHVYANVQGQFTELFYPQYVANAFNGQPAIRFRSTNFANIASDLYVSNETSNIYPYSSFGGTVNAQAMHYGDSPKSVPTSTLRANTMLADPRLARPVSNSWTLMIVGKLNAHHSSFHYGHQKGHHATTTIGPLPTPFSSGFDGHKYGPGGNTLKTLSGGAIGISLNWVSHGSGNELISSLSSNSTSYTQVRTPDLQPTGSLSHVSEVVNNYFMFGMSESANVWSRDDLINFHHNGRRYANSELVQSIPANFTGTQNMYNTELDGVIWETQNNYRTSIGGWSPANNQINESGTYGVTGLFGQEGTHQWDGDLSEILVFNEKLSNTSVALVEGYLAHKYGLQESLVHKDGTNAANTYAYKWTFANTEDGWIASGGVGTVTKQGDPHANLIFETVSGGADQAIEIKFPSHPIDGSGFYEVKLRMMRRGSSAGTWRGNLTWTTTDEQLEHHDPPGGGPLFPYGSLLVSSEPDGTDTSVFVDYYADLSSKWSSHKVTGLKLWFQTGADSSEKYYIDEISIYNSTRKHHPFRYDPPTSVYKFANTWYKDY